MGLDAGGEHLQLKGLGQVVVGPQSKAGDDILGGILGAQKEDGTLYAVPDAAADLKAVHALHHDIQQDELEALPLQNGEGLLARGGGGDGETLVAQHVGDQEADGGVVVHHKYFSAHLSHFLSL